ncbi:MAG TPA: hypothetical protein PLN50_04735 [Coprothermobacter proteolyticus]|uniref:Uncharacterized protein n=1 Tax=Coprothermobacter proteolyticus (strain ATCC 35245 / DSM 5265 / OCM 4 / BT) TaxID=309798 RepID=B5Y689_COPPD|nr:hypothetical protein COPRO5265_1510 [Coprothermobacter proteolyticus DSM 5265]HPO84027.1 hypothetical protein [Coprothermobacter proteolyticus]
MTEFEHPPRETAIKVITKIEADTTSTTNATLLTFFIFSNEGSFVQVLFLPPVPLPSLVA